jgi:diguanylate cyclase (GGDEF)-like protein/PAS domain S-box-containing protein
VDVVVAEERRDEPALVERARTAERRVRRVVDQAGRFPERRLVPGDLRRDVIVGAAALLVCAALQVSFPFLGGVSVLLALSVAWLATRAGLAAGLAGAAAALASSSVRDVIATDGVPLTWSFAVRVAGFAAVAVVSSQMTRRLRASDELLHGILGGTTDAIAVKDLAGRYVLANDAALETLGGSREEVLGRTDADLLAPDVAQSRRRHDEAALSSGQTQRYWRTAARAGGELTHSVVKVPYRDGDGRIVGIVSVARDETAMRRLEEETGRFFDLAPDMLCTIGPDGHFERLNAGWSRVLGWTDDELRSRPVRDFVHPEDRALAGQKLELLLDGTLGASTTRVATRAGGWRDVEWSVRREPQGRRVHAVARDVSDRSAMERRLADTEAMYRELVHNLPGAAVLTFDHDLRFTFAAGEALESLGGSGYDGQTLGQALPGSTTLAGRFRAALAGQEQRFEHAADNGATFWVRIAPLRAAAGDIAGGMVLAMDISDRKAVEREITQAEGRFRSAFDQAPIGMALVSLDGRYLQVNEALCAITGFPAGELLHRTVSSITHPDDRGGCEGGRGALIAGETAAYRVEKRYVHADGHAVWVDVHATMVRDADGRPSHVLGQIQDVTDRRRFERRLQHLADHDPLTGLLNRRRFEEELARHAAAVARYGVGGALLVLDLDDFKLVNDSLGHSKGDALIVAVAEILGAHARASDLVARLGGDEFAVLLPFAQLAEAEDAAARLVRAVREGAPVVDAGRTRRVTASVGIAAFAEGVDADELLISADLAMYDAKKAGRDGYAVHRPEADPRPRVQADMDLLARIREAVAGDTLVLHAQPILDLRTRAIGQYELLVRLPDGDGGLVAPAVFLPLAERYDLVQEIDRWVACRAIDLVAEHAGLGLRVTVNLSGRTLGDATLLDAVERALERTGADPGRITFEVTETAAVSNLAVAREFAERLRSIGCRLALDDFGAGFGSFYYLKHLPFDYLKIDGEFVATCLSSRTDQLVIRAVVDIAQGLGKETIAEFAGDPEQVRFLASQGVDHAQGFGIGRPAPLAEALAALAGARA